MIIRQMGAELMHAEKQTDMTKLRVDFRNLSNAPKQNDIHDINTVLLESYFNSVAVTVLNHLFKYSTFLHFPHALFMCFMRFSDKIFYT